MKPPAELHNELREMKFFTPDLYLRINSPNGDVVDAAMEQWEQAIKNYKKHLTKIRNKRTPANLLVVTELALHDWEVIDMGAKWAAPFALEKTSGSSILSRLSRTLDLVVRHGPEVVLLHYVLWSDLVTRECAQEWPFSKSRVHWLYDEIDETDRHLVHRILFSNGRTVTIPFLLCFVGRISVGQELSSIETLQPA